MELERGLLPFSFLSFFFSGGGRIASPDIFLCSPAFDLEDFRFVDIVVDGFCLPDVVFTFCTTLSL